MASNAILVKGWIEVGRRLPIKPTNLTDSKQIKMLLGLVLEELTELSQAMEGGLSLMEELLVEKISDIQAGKIKQDTPSIYGCLDALVDLEFVVHNTTAQMGLGNIYQPNFTRVLESNYSKFVSNLDDVDASIKKYKDQGMTVTAEFFDNRNLFVLKRDDGKIMKGIHYKPPVLTLDVFQR